jgi:hypothetical protein
MGQGDSADDGNLDEMRTRLGGLLDAADRVMAGIRPLRAEQYVQQHRQHGAQ